MRLKKFRKIIPCVFYLLIILNGSPNLTWARIEGACTATEKWNWESWVPETIRLNYKNPPSEKSESIALLIEAERIKFQSRSADVRLLASFLIYRSSLELGLVHFASRGFNSLLEQPFTPFLSDLLISSLSCLDKIHRSHPSIQISPSSLNALSGLQVENLKESEKQSYWQGIYSIAGAKLSQRTSTTDVSSELRLLRGSGPYELMVLTLDAAKKSNYADARKYSEKLIKDGSIPLSMQAQLDGIHLNLARMYYQDKLYDKSVEEYAKMHSDSNLFSFGILERSWDFLLKKNYSDAVASSLNFKVGELRNLFSPESDVILTISYYENCRYKQAMASLQYFKKKYKLAYQTLYSWYYDQKKSPIDYYEKLISYMKGNKKALPKSIALEWLRSPRFMYQQEEVNLFFDEKDKASVLFNEFNQMIANAKAADRGFLGLARNEMLGIVRGALPAQQQLVAQINMEILWRNYSMISALVEAHDNFQLLEVDILRSTGESALDKGKNMDKSGLKVGLSSKSNKSRDLVPTLDWGDFQAQTGDTDSSEFWDDELGDIKTEVTNLCR